MDKKFEFEATEKEIAEFWKKEKLYSFKENSSDETFSIDTPPPYASADHLHVGHGMSYSHFEFIARYKRMQGFNVFFPMGFDDNGLPTERFVEKKHKIDKNKISREDFIKLCIEETKIAGKTYEDLFTGLGFSIDWNLLYHTIGPRATSVSQRSFLELYKKGLLYRKDSPVMWDTKLQTVLAQADTEDLEMSSHFNDIIFKCEGKDLVIGTTRPEMLSACVALLYHPSDSRYKGLKGKFAKVPLYDFEVPILEDELVALDKGTGLVMCCTFGDKTDIEWWQKHNLPLKIIINEYGKLTERAGFASNLNIRDARKLVIEKLKEKNLLINQKPITHAVKVSERSGAEIEFLKSAQWYINVLDKKQELIDVANKIEWKPKHMKVRFDHWVSNLGWDWCISRQRYYGVPFPVWYSKKTGEVILADESQLPVDPMKDKPLTLPKDHTYDDIVPETDVMDTWMTSSNTPHINANYGLSNERRDFLPMSMHPQAHDIIRTWAFYCIIKAYYQQGSIPWKTIMISGHGQDPQGKKMSKSKGNFVVAGDVISKYGADAFRFWASTVKLGDDLPYQEKDVQTGKKTVNKIANASRFVFMNMENFNPEGVNLNNILNEKINVIDKWMLSKLSKAIKNSTLGFEEFEYSKAKQAVDSVFWQVFCDNYLEFVKYRVYNSQDDSVLKVLYVSLLNIVKLYAPILPFISEFVYKEHFEKFEGDKSIHISRWPLFNENLIDETSETAGDLAVRVVDEVRKYKSSKQLSLKAELEKVVIVANEKDLMLLESVLLDIKEVSSIKDLELVESDEFKVVFE
jgi:valyl-tRNA synthetase